MAPDRQLYVWRKRAKLMTREKQNEQRAPDCWLTYMQTDLGGLNILLEFKPKYFQK